MDAHRSTYCHFKRFALQMRFLQILQVKVLNLDQALSKLRARQRVPGHAVVLTFDDGYADLTEYVTPILQKYGFLATIYLLSGCIGQRAHWFAADNRETPLLLDLSSIYRLMNQGFIFGSHGVSHVKLAQVDHELMKQEIRKSKYDLEKDLGIDIKHFCYPYGDYNEGVIKEVRNAGYETAVTCLRSAVTERFSPFELPRKAISYGDSLFGFLWKLFFKNSPKKQPLLSPDDVS